MPDPAHYDSVARDLPSGTVTFLFTDIEGSTRLLQALPDRYAELLEEHGRLIRRAIATHGGTEIGTEGIPSSRSLHRRSAEWRRALRRNAILRRPSGLESSGRAFEWGCTPAKGG